MKTLTVPIPDWNHTLPRVVVLCLAIAGLGLATWYGTRPPPIDDGASFVEPAQASPPNGYNTQTQPVVYRDRGASDGQCSQWDVSPQAMEAILQEMLRRGWKPPTQGEAIASLEPSSGPRIVSLDPNAPMPVFTRPIAPPAETAAPEEGVVSSDPDPAATTPATPSVRPPAAAPARPPAAQSPIATPSAPAVRPPAAGPSRPPAAQPPVTTPPRVTPPAVSTPRPQVTPPPAAAPKPAPVAPPVASPPAAAPAPPVAAPAEPADPT